LTQSREPARVGAAVHAAESREQAMPGTTIHPASRVLVSGAALAIALGAVACTPTLRIEASDKPITINLNVKIDQEIRYRLDKDLEDAIASNPNLF
jgi:hypothetical protein